MIAGAIRHAPSRQVALFLLTDYVATRRHWRRTNQLPARALQLPVYGAYDILVRITVLDASLRRPAPDPDRAAAIRDARVVFEAALDRLCRCATSRGEAAVCAFRGAVQRAA